MKEPTYILALTPEQPNSIKRLFEFGQGMPNEKLENPGAFRYAGWSMETLDQARIVDGKYIEVKNGDRKTLRLYEDGSFVVTGAIDGNFLAWGNRKPDQPVTVHALAIVEFTAAFVYLYKELIPTLDKTPTSIAFHVEITNGDVDGKLLRLVPHAVNTYGALWGDDSEALRVANPKHTGEILASDLLADPDSVAFEIVRRLFLFFNIAENKIPYVNETDGVRRVDVAKIREMTR